MKMKSFLYFNLTLFILLANTVCYAQIKKDSLISKPADTSKIIKKKSLDSIKKNSSDSTKIIRKRKIQILPRDTVIKKKPDTSVVIMNPAQPKITVPIKNITDTVNVEADSSISIPQTPAKNFRNISNDLLSHNKYINVKDPPVFFMEQERFASGKEFLFYAIAAILLILGIFKTFYRAYFNNLFRVFFNTSLRQSQLSEQLLQATLPSFILNIFFTITGGIYLWLLFNHFHPLTIVNSKLLLPFCLAAIAILYFSKYILLKFIGWLTDIRETTDNYIFVIFLVNKITGIILVPFVILLAFSKPEWVSSIATISLLVVGLFFLSRYVKSYGIIQKKISVHPFHFIIYVAGAEIIPLFLIYKLAMDYLI